MKSLTWPHFPGHLWVMEIWRVVMLLISLSPSFSFSTTWCLFICPFIHKEMERQCAYKKVPAEHTSHGVEGGTVSIAGNPTGSTWICCGLKEPTVFELKGQTAVHMYAVVGVHDPYCNPGPFIIAPWHVGSVATFGVFSLDPCKDSAVGGWPYKFRSLTWLAFPWRPSHSLTR